MRRNMLKTSVFLIFSVLRLLASTRTEPKENPEVKKDDSKLVNSSGDILIVCNDLDTICKRDNISLVAIYEIHRMIDDDQNGNVDQSESDEFMRDELQIAEGSEKLSIFHGNDKLISVEDLWKAWKKSVVYNWTVDEVAEWLVKHVELSQYVQAFRNGNIDGKMLPSLAVPNSNFSRNVLGIKNGVHRQKISVKAMDLVLFGPPREKPNLVKDVALILSLVIALGGCWFALAQHKYSKAQIRRMNSEMEHLQKAEESLMALQEKLHKAEEEQKSFYKEKESLQMKYKDEIEHAKKEADKLRMERQGTEMEENETLQLAEQELEQMRAALKRAEKELARKTWSAPSELQAWLQLSYEMEQIYFNQKKREAELQLEFARDECRKIQRKRGAFLGPLRMAPGNSMDHFDQKIEEARSALEEVRLSLQEKSQRWNTIEKLCGFPITVNPGKEKLSQVLERDLGSPTSYPTFVMGSLNVDDAELDEDTQYAMFYHPSLANGISRPKYQGYPAMGTLRQRPKTLANSSGSLISSTGMGSNSSLQRIALQNTKVFGSKGSSSSVESPVSPGTDPLKDADRPTFSLEDNVPDSPLINSVIPEKDSGSDTSSNNSSPLSPVSAKVLYNGTSTLPRSRTSTDPNKGIRDSMGNTSLPSQGGNRVTSLPKSQSEANVNHLLQISNSTEDKDRLEAERQNNKKKRTFLKLFTKKNKS